MDADRELRRRALLEIPRIRSWRETQDAAGNPSGLRDYFLAHRVCPDCHGLGLNWRDARCPSCDGTGGGF